MSSSRRNRAASLAVPTGLDRAHPQVQPRFTELQRPKTLSHSRARLARLRDGPWGATDTTIEPMRTRAGPFSSFPPSCAHISQGVGVGAAIRVPAVSALDGEQSDGITGSGDVYFQRQRARSAPQLPTVALLD